MMRKSIEQPPQFDLKHFRSALKTDVLGRVLHYFETIGSTNTHLKEMLSQNSAEIPHGTIALTDFQSTGRGRLGRQWSAPPRTALLVSLLIRPQFSPAWLPMIAGLAAVGTLESTTASLKWPNDVMLADQDGQWRKVAGILVELQTDPDGSITAIVGMGLNVNLAADQLPPAATPATSLRVALGEPVSRELLLARWLKRLEDWLISAENGHSPQPAWNKCLITLNQPVTVRGALTIDGIAESTDEWGRLLVRDAAGRLHACAAGDVTLRGSQAA